MARRLYARGPANLGQVIDERFKQNTNKLVYPRDLGQAIPAPQSSGATASNGGGAAGGGGAPAGGSTAAGAGLVVMHFPGISFAPLAEMISWDMNPVANRPYRAAAWPPGAVLAPVQAEPHHAAELDPPAFGRNCAYFCWSSEPAGEGIGAGAAIALGAASAKAWHGAGFSTRAVVRACVRVEAPQRFSALQLALQDLSATETSSHCISADVLSACADNEWTEVVLEPQGTDISLWDSELRVGLVILGTTVPAQAGWGGFGVAWLRLELWAA